MDTILIKEHFFDIDFCNALIANSSEQKLALVNSAKRKGIYQPNIRRTYNVKLKAHQLEQIKKRLSELIPELMAKFDVSIDSLSEISNLQYNIGHFFKPHRDAGTHSKSRLLTAIIYLNDSEKYSVNENSFQGGELIIYGTNNKFPNVGLPIFSKMGRLVVFPSELLHEVKPITKGIRYCLVAWFLKK